MAGAGRQKTWPLWAGVVASVAAALWLTRGVWGAAPQGGDDIMALLVWEDFSQAQLREGRLHAWAPHFVLGYERWLVYGPGFSVLVALVDLAGVGLMSTTLALKIVSVAAFAALGPAAAFLARSLHLAPAAAGAGAVLALAVDSPFGIGVHGTFTTGLLAQQVGAVLLVLTLGLLVRVVDDGRRRWVLAAAAGLAAIAVTHPISLAVLALAAVLVVGAALLEDMAAAVRRRPEHPQGQQDQRHQPAPLAAVARLAGAGVISLGLAGFWLVPYLARQELQGPATGLGIPPLWDRITDIAAGAILYRSWLPWLVGAGLVWGVVRVARRQRRALAVAVAGPGFLVGAHLLHAWWPTELTMQLPIRGLAVAGLLAFLPTASLLAAPASVVSRRRLWKGTATTVLRVGGLAAAVAVVVLAGPAGPEPTTLPPASDELAAAAAVLADHVPEGARFATERNWPDEIAVTGVVHPDFWLARRSGRWTLNQFGIESSTTPGAGSAPEHLGSRPATESGPLLARYGVTHVVTVRPDTLYALAASSSFRPVWNGDHLAVLAVVAPPGWPPPSSLVAPVPAPPGNHPAGAAALDAALVEVGDGYFRLEVETGTARPVTVAVAWHPSWRATEDGEPVAVNQAPDGLIELDVPAGRHTVELWFGPDGWDRVGQAVSLTTVGVVAVAVGWTYSSSLRSRRRSFTA